MLAPALMPSSVSYTHLDVYKRQTVDRALNNRGRIRPEVEEKIKKIAREMGYQPSRAGRALAMAKRKIRIGVILSI